tara:strand:+ start:216 stop:1007 length:792 start_codon:yes stop_codon:yes gene_type:complete
MEAFKVLGTVKNELKLPNISSFTTKSSPKKGLLNSIKRGMKRSAWKATKQILIPQTQIVTKKNLQIKEKEKLIKKANMADKLIFNNEKNIKILLLFAPKDYNLTKFKSSLENKIFALELFKQAKILQYYQGKDSNIRKIQALVRGVAVRKKNILTIKKNEKLIKNLFIDTMKKHYKSLGRKGNDTPRFNSSGSRHSNSSNIIDKELLLNTSINKKKSDKSSTRYYSANSRVNSSLLNSTKRRIMSEPYIRSSNKMKEYRKFTL